MLRLLRDLRPLPLVLGVVLLGLVPTAHAQAVPSTGDADVQPSADVSLESLLSVEVQSVFGASKFLQKLTDAPAAVSVVTADDIQRYGWRTLADVLRNVRGFYVTDDRAYGYVGMRGFLRPGDYTTRILVLVDGHRLNDNVFDQALVQEDFQVDLRDVDRIEVIRGPSSSLYGSNAFFAVINVITKAPGANEGVRVSADAGTLGQRIARLSMARELSNGLGLSVAVSEERTDGNRVLYFPDFDDPRSHDGLATGLDHTTRQNVLGRARYGGVSVTAGYNQRRRGLPTAAFGTIFNDPRAFVFDDHALVDVAWDHALAGGWTGRFRGAYDFYRFDGSYPYFADDADPSAGTVEYRDRALGDWVTGEAQFSRTWSTRHRFTAGVEHRQNLRQNQWSYLVEPYNPEWSDARASGVTGVYAQDEFRLHPTLLVNAGVRYDHYADFADPLKPRAALIYQPRSHTAVKLLYGEAFRAPNVFERFYIIPGRWKDRPDLQSEDIRTTEALLERYFAKRMRVSAGLFAYTVKGLIDFTSDPVDNLAYFRNLDTASATGYEIEAESKWPGGTQARVGYTFSHVRSGDGGRLSNAPAHVVQGLLSTRLPGDATVGLDVAMLSARLTRTGATIRRYVRPNLTVSGPLWSRSLAFSFVVSNLTDTQFADPVGDDYVPDRVNQNGRTVRLSVTWSPR